MAWPLTPLTTYVAGTVPAIKAADLNSIQTGVNGIVAATYSLAAVVLDGTGGATVTPVGGTAKLSATAAGTTTPTPTVGLGVMYKDLVPSAWGRVNCTNTISFITGVNINAVSRTGQGVYEIDLVTNLAIEASNPIIVGSVNYNINASGSAKQIAFNGIGSTNGGHQFFQILAFDAGGTAQDLNGAVSFVVFGV